MLLGRAQPGCQGGFVLRGGYRCPQAALDGCGVGVVREEAALGVAVGGGYRRLPRGVEEARQDQTDREVVRPDHLRVRHASGPDTFPQGPRQEGLVDQEGVHPVPGRVERGGHVLCPTCRGPPEAASLPPGAEMFRGRVGRDVHIDVGVASDSHRCRLPRPRAVAYIWMSAQNAARPAQEELPACGPWTLMRVRPPLSVRISRAAAFPGTISVKLSTLCSATYLQLTAVRRPPPREVEPVSTRRLLKKGDVTLVPERGGYVHLLRPGGDPRLLEHYGEAPLPGQHSRDEVLLVSAGRRPSALPESVFEGAVRRDETVAPVPGEQPEGVVRRVLLRLGVSHERWRRRVRRGR